MLYISDIPHMIYLIYHDNIGDIILTIIITIGGTIRYSTKLLLQWMKSMHLGGYKVILMSVMPRKTSSLCIKIINILRIHPPQWNCIVSIRFIISLSANVAWGGGVVVIYDNYKRRQLKFVGVGGTGWLTWGYLLNDTLFFHLYLCGPSH